MKTNKEIRSAARLALKGRYGMPILGTIIYFAIAIGISAPAQGVTMGDMIPFSFWMIISFTSILEFFILGPIVVGLGYSFLKLFRENNDDVPSNMFRYGFGNYLHIVWGLLAYFLKVLLWSLLFIIPGFVMSFAYALTPFILVEKPELSGWEASKESRRLMKGHKWQLFLMYLGFLGYMILGVFTLFIAWLWIYPFMYTSFAAFYESVKEDDAATCATC